MDGTHRSPLLIGIDIGGTFTDFVVHDLDNGQITTAKFLSTPLDPSQAVIAGLNSILREITHGSGKPTKFTITHGSTVATNALLERKGARTALITTAGFRDLIEIGRQNRDSLYDLFTKPRETLVKEPWRYEIGERVDFQGQVLQAIDQGELLDLVSTICDQPIDSVAVSLLFSFLNPQSEQQIAEALEDSGLYISLSSQILPEYREFERTSTTILNAYVTPVIDRYLRSLETMLVNFEIPHQLRIMQSNGGIISVGEARKAGVQCIVSGPAGGVVGASYIGQLSINATLQNSGFRNPEPNPNLRLIAFDMGGTSTDVCMIDGQPSISTESIVGGFPIGIPMLDVHTIGAGGGSIARVDLGGALRVGPESAGAEPGPACYAFGLQYDDLPTVTDANVVLGRLPVDNFLGGKMKLDATRAYAVMKKLGQPLGLDAIQTAQGVIEVINAHMERALRLVTIERGHDPESFVLLSFGGAGGLHAVQLAKNLSIPRVIVPPLASTLSAFGMLIADAIKDYSKTVMLPGVVNKEDLDALFQDLIEKGTGDLLAQGFEATECRFDSSLDVRYRGQSFDLNIPYGKDFISDFHQTYDLLYGYSHPNADIEIVNIRLKATGLTSVPEMPSFDAGDGDIERALLGYRQVVVDQEKIEVPMFTGEKLIPGDQIHGPAILVRQDTTIYLPPESLAQTDSYLNQLITTTE